MQILSQSVRQTLYIGKRLSRHLRKGDILCLCGGLGSGKTVLVKGIAQGLGVAKNRITSPSFVLLRQYHRARLPLYHFDLYRLKALKDIAYLGYHEYLYGEGVSVIEWAERLGRLLPAEYLGVELSVKGNRRRLLKFKACGRHYQELLAKINENLRP